MGNLEHPGGGPTPRLERLDDDHDNDASMMELIPPAIKGKMNKHMLQKKIGIVCVVKKNTGCSFSFLMFLIYPLRT